ncbi:bifunctional 4-hydroxy-2-oxoglutarate aldolase/2-dehydro-3-deoxy-phosphogluconate aldolase [Microbacterium sp.]|uniref:bifunctional 4-hydroxy-2-oxoglutarate aldolase/2-dehydro-3-deoxy-phosphogluconate aldolase n=1 Tax=Microbacterium sp. TaxID=51671 RepID=UPI0025EE8595|nr:bifunctional 4-hydroxy-2-oxoglutarate aldolase/2-dehydro-3-deoxy-phosphogluconate aldolase [Microbacterium sp.]
MSTVAEALKRDVVVAVVRAEDAAGASRAVDALVAGGVRGIEITFTTPGAEEAIAVLAQRYGKHITLGAGTIRTAAQATIAVEAGAAFLVSPGTDVDLAVQMASTRAFLLLGALTPSEVLSALSAGAGFVKLFPASLGGPAYLRSLRGPFPDVAFCPTGGVNPTTIPDWLSAGAVALGAGSELCSSAQIAAGDWTGIEENARAFAAAARS